jgi:ArsR family metal-binding transcriptional regulator
MSQNLIRSYEIKMATPECYPENDRYRAFVNLQDDISEVLPYLNAELGGRRDYYHDGKILLWANNEKLFAFRPHEIAIAPVLSIEEAQKLTTSIIDTVNNIWNRRNEIKPNFEAKKHFPNVLDIYKLLPGTNCKECGLPTCMAFAATLRSDSTKSSLCPYLSEQAYMRLLSSGL